MLRKGRWSTLALALAATAAFGACDDDDDNGTDPILPPAAPTVSATASDDAITVSWNAVAHATSYDVQRQTAGSGGAFTTIGDDVTGTSYTDDAVEAGVTYNYQVIATGQGGSSNASNVASIVIGLRETTLSGTISAARTLSADTTYFLRGIVTVDAGATLTVEPGTRILGDVTVQPSALIVRQDGRLVADGTADAPIVFTSSAAEGERQRGDWGGVVLNGRSICNFPADDCVGEGSSGSYGGSELDDDSGVLRYVRIEYAGYEVSFGNELNALTLNGVGSGTDIEYVQTHYGSDDGFEWFGGTVDARYLVATGISDDSFDFSTGWQGRGQFWIAQQDPDDADAGYEADGNEDDYDAAPLTDPTVYNVTLVGKGLNGQGGTAGESTSGMVLRRGLAGDYYNHIVLGFGGVGVDIDNAETVGRVTMQNSIVFGNATNFSGDDDGIDETAMLTQAGWNNRVVDPQLAAPFDRDDPDFRPAAGSPAMSGAATPPDDGVFDASATYVGAVPAGGDEWYLGWTTWAQN